MPDLTLYHASPSRSSVALWMLEEVGQPYDIKLLQLERGRQPEARLSRHQSDGQGAGAQARRHGDHRGRGDLHLSGRRISRRRNSTCRSARRKRGVYLKWLFFGPGCIEPAVIDRAAPRKEEARRAMLGYGDFDTTMNVLAKAVEKGPWLMGEQFTAADVLIGANIRWGMMFKMIPERKEFTDYVARIVARPAAQRAEAKDKEFAAQAA